MSVIEPAQGGDDLIGRDQFVGSEVDAGCHVVRLLGSDGSVRFNPTSPDTLTLPIGRLPALS